MWSISERCFNTIPEAAHCVRNRAPTGLTPRRTVKGHLGFGDDMMNRLPQIKPFILPENKNLTETT